MLRSQVLQPILDLYQAPHYLEIGVCEGNTFRALKAGRKVAVDPAFCFDVAAAAAEDATAEFHPVTSDAFFNTSPVERRPFDVCYIDGLHTLEQTLRDLLAVLARVHARSVVVIDDVLPCNYAASLKDHGAWIKLRSIDDSLPDAWMGDVYRLVYFIAAFLPDWSYSTVADNHGQLIMWREGRPVTERTLEAVARVPYEETVTDRAVFNVQSYEATLEHLRSRLSHPKR